MAVVGPICSTCPFSASPLLRFPVLLFVHYFISLAQLAAAPWKSRCQDADWPSRMAQIFRDILVMALSTSSRTGSRFSRDQQQVEAVLEPIGNKSYWQVFAVPSCYKMACTAGHHIQEA
ncbi:hypothetical protein HDV63DRAFT_376193 [Trichoderma sp. SZMC 28014]